MGSDEYRGLRENEPEKGRACEDPFQERLLHYTVSSYGQCKTGATYMTYQWWIGACNELTTAKLDPISNTPEYKYCACRVEKIEDQQWAERHVMELYDDIRAQMGIDTGKGAKA